MKYTRVLCMSCAVLCIVALCACGAGEDTAPRGVSYFTYFDTVSYVYSYAGDSADRFEELSAEASAILGDYHRLFDIYHEYAGINNLCTLNKNAGGDALPVDSRLIDFLLCTKELCALTNGECNVMLGAVLAPWHEAREQAQNAPGTAAVPDAELLRDAAEHTDISLLEIDAERGTVRIADPEARIDVGSVGKGYAVEMAARRLRELGAESYVLNVGGNIRTIGSRPDGTGWVTGVKDPNDPDGAFALKLDIKNISCVTSGVYERYFTVDGVRYHHIIDKDTLDPAQYYLSLTVLTEDSGLADALSTALFCMPPDEVRALISSTNGVDAVWILPDGTVEYTDGAAAMIVQ